MLFEFFDKNEENIKKLLEDQYLLNFDITEIKQLFEDLQCNSTIDTNNNLSDKNKHLLSLLKEHYLIHFEKTTEFPIQEKLSDRSFFANVFILGNKNSPDEKTEIKKCEELLMWSLAICSKVFPTTMLDHLHHGNKLLISHVADMTKKMLDSNSLLLYVLTDTIKSIYKDEFDKSENKKFNSTHNLYNALSADIKEKNNYSNFNKLYNVAKEYFFADELINFGINDYIKERIIESKNTDAENSIVKNPADTENATQRHETYSKPSSTFAYKLLGNIIFSIKKNPYYLLKINNDIDYNITSENLWKFFNKLYYRFSKNNDDYDFRPTDKFQKIFIYHYLDRYYDLDNNIYIVKKINEFNNKGLLNTYNINKLYDLFYLCFLIPDTFSKKLYIDRMFDCLENKDLMHCTYKELRDGNNIVATNTNDYNQQTITEDNALKACKDYIMYLSKIYLPVLSSCFYVLFKKYYYNGETKQLDEIVSFIEKYYDKKTSLIIKKDYRESNFADLQKHDIQLGKVYKLIWSQILDNKKNYNDIKNSLSFNMNLTSNIKLLLLDKYIEIITSANVNIKDPLGYETQECLFSSINNMYNFPNYNIPDMNFKATTAISLLSAYLDHITE